MSFNATQAMAPKDNSMVGLVGDSQGDRQKKRRRYTFVFMSKKTHTSQNPSTKPRQGIPCRSLLFQKTGRKPILPCVLPLAQAFFCTLCFPSLFGVGLLVMAQLAPFDIGQVKAHMHHGLGAVKISQILLKADGKSKWTDTAVQDCMNKFLADKSCRGERPEGSGPPPQNKIGKVRSEVQGRTESYSSPPQGSVLMAQGFVGFAGGGSPW